MWGCGAGLPTPVSALHRFFSRSSISVRPCHVHPPWRACPGGRGRPRRCSDIAPAAGSWSSRSAPHALYRRTFSRRSCRHSGTRPVLWSSSPRPGIFLSAGRSEVWAAVDLRSDEEGARVLQPPRMALEVGDDIRSGGQFARFAPKWSGAPLSLPLPSVGGSTGRGHPIRLSCTSHCLPSVNRVF